MNQDGSVQLQVGATEIGQGADTVLGQIAAEAIGIPFDMVHIISTQDTDVSPFDTGAYASRETYVSGLAVKKAGEEIKAKLLERVHWLTDIPLSALDVVNGWVVWSHSGERIMSVEDVAMDSYYTE